MKRFVVGICGASGSVYGAVLLKTLLENPVAVHAVVSPAGKEVMAHELGFDGDLASLLKTRFNAEFHPQAKLTVHPHDRLWAPMSSGSFRHNGMAVVPCSMKTLAAVAAGYGDNLITRSADVCLKEKRPLILVPRETPLSVIHLENMLRLARAGAVILPPCPAFYRKPETIADLVNAACGRVLDHLNVDHNLAKEWGHEEMA